MQNYSEMTGAARYAELDTLAREIYGPRWKGRFAAEYGLTAQTVTAWRSNGAPIWACKAAHMMLTLKHLRTAQRALNVALSEE